jgi:hypothetical protein
VLENRERIGKEYNNIGMAEVSATGVGGTMEVLSPAVTNRSPPGRFPGDRTSRGYIAGAAVFRRHDRIAGRYGV